METNPQSKILKTEPVGFETPIVTEIKPPKPKLNFSHLRLLGSLPDNVFMLRLPNDEPPETPGTEALAA